MRRLSCLIALLACLVLALPAFAAPQIKSQLVEFRSAWFHLHSFLV